MSVRPITVSESTKAFGHPFANIFAVFGGLQGMLFFLHIHRIPFKSNWFAQAGTFPRFAVLTFGGFFLSGFAATFMFKDDELLRLHRQHKRDKSLMIDGQILRAYSA